MPYGFVSQENTLVEQPAEWRAIALMRRLRRAGESLRQICTELGVWEFRPRSAKRWHPDVVARSLRNPLHNALSGDG